MDFVLVGVAILMFLDVFDPDLNGIWKVHNHNMHQYWTNPAAGRFSLIIQGISGGFMLGLVVARFIRGKRSHQDRSSRTLQT